MKRHGILIILFLAILVPRALYAATGDVWMEPANPSVDLGASFTLEVHADTGTQSLAAYQFTIAFDPALVNVDTSKGTLGVEAGADTQTFLMVVNPNNTVGTLEVGGLDTNGANSDTDIHVLTAHFTAVGHGQATIGHTVEELVDTSPSPQPIGAPTPRPGTGSVVLITDPAGGGGGGGGGGGCFIATAAYGSYLDPNVRVLRDFRDAYLLTNPAGRALVEFYYRTSPPIAEYIGRHESIRTAARVALTPLVYGVKHPGASLALSFLTGVLVAACWMRGRKRFKESS